MAHDAIDSKLLFKENRDEIFLERFSADCSQLLDAGVPHDVVKKVVSNYAYVKTFILVLNFVFPIKKLPKGAKWSNGEKTKFSSGHGVRKGYSRTIILLPYGDNLYVKDTRRKSLPGMPEFEDFQRKIPSMNGYEIRGYRSLTAREIILKWSLMDSEFSEVILNFYKKRQLNSGYYEPLRGLVCFCTNPDPISTVNPEEDENGKKKV